MCYHHVSGEERPRRLKPPRCQSNPPRRSRSRSYEERFPSLTFAQPESGVLEIIISNPRHLNAADAGMHRDLASVSGGSRHR